MTSVTTDFRFYARFNGPRLGQLAIRGGQITLSISSLLLFHRDIVPISLPEIPAFVEKRQ